jgi:hypothetical protein
MPYPVSNFDDYFKVQVLNVEAALTDASFPASGSFIDVSKYQRVVFLVGLGALTSAVTFKVQQATAVNGALVDVTSATKTIAATDDNKWFTIEVDVAKLTINSAYRYVTLTTTGTAGGDDYATIIAFLYGAEAPVTQSTSYYDAIVVAG